MTPSGAVFVGRITTLARAGPSPKARPATGVNCLEGRPRAVAHTSPLPDNRSGPVDGVTDWEFVLMSPGRSAAEANTSLRRPQALKAMPCRGTRWPSRHWRVRHDPCCRKPIHPRKGRGSRSTPPANTRVETSRSLCRRRLSLLPLPVSSSRRRRWRCRRRLRFHPSSRLIEL